MGQVVVRGRTPQDIPVLADVLAAQRPHSGYPQNWPLPYPVEDFIARADEDAAWTAELDGHAVGHVAVSRVEPGMEADLWTAGTGRRREELAAVAVLFVDHTVQGRGVGKALLGTAVAAIRESGRTPVLDVVQETPPLSSSTGAPVGRWSAKAVPGGCPPTTFPCCSWCCRTDAGADGCRA